jgi:hypothetical protein
MKSEEVVRERSYKWSLATEANVRQDMGRRTVETPWWYKNVEEHRANPGI